MRSDRGVCDETERGRDKAEEERGEGEGRREEDGGGGKASSGELAGIRGLGWMG